MHLLIYKKGKQKYINWLYRQRYNNFNNDKLVITKFNITKGDLVFDIGANKGDKTDVFISMGAKVLSVEPDEYCYEILNSRFNLNQNVSLLKCAVADVDSTEEFFKLGDGNVLNTLSMKWKEIVESDPLKRFKECRLFQNTEYVQTYSLNTLIQKYGIPKLIKVDVEGYEWNVFSNLNCDIENIIFEANLPEFYYETVKIINKFYEINKNYKFNVVQNNELLFSVWLNFKQILDFVTETKLLYCEICVSSLNC